MGIVIFSKLAAYAIAAVIAALWMRRKIDFSLTKALMFCVFLFMLIITLSPTTYNFIEIALKSNKYDVNLIGTLLNAPISISVILMIVAVKKMENSILNTTAALAGCAWFVLILHVLSYVMAMDSPRAYSDSLAYVALGAYGSAGFATLLSGAVLKKDNAMVEPLRRVVLWPSYSLLWGGECYVLTLVVGVLMIVMYARERGGSAVHLASWAPLVYGGIVVLASTVVAAVVRAFGWAKVSMETEGDTP
jgi:hypothetical protein